MLIVLKIIWSQNDETGVLEVQTFKGFLYVQWILHFVGDTLISFFFSKKNKNINLSISSSSINRDSLHLWKK